MLFLLNDTVLDIGLPAETLARLGGASASQARMANAIAAGQGIIFTTGSFQKVPADLAIRVAAEIASTSEANAALFVRPDRARSAAQVGVRLASVSISTLAFILIHQEKYGADPTFINEQVWSLAGAA